MSSLTPWQSTLGKSKKSKGEILHCAQNDRKRYFVILEEPKATKDLEVLYKSKTKITLTGHESLGKISRLHFVQNDTRK